MQKEKKPLNYFFVDEAGDPTFYNSKGECIVGTEGCSKILLLGFITTTNPQPLRESILTLQKEILQDPYLKKIPSLAKTAIAFHAKDDCPEVRERVFNKIIELDFKAEFIVARKIPDHFKSKHQGKPHIFYDDLIIKLFQNKLHLAEKNNIYFATRGSKTRQAPLQDAIRVASNAFEKKWDTTITAVNDILPQTPSGEPCLQIVDYMNWAVQRAFIKGEDRYLNFVQNKISYLCDVYDFKKYPNNFYSKKKPFALNKISPL